MSKKKIKKYISDNNIIGNIRMGGQTKYKKI